MKRRFGTDLLWLALGVVVLVVIAFARDAAERRPPPSVLSTYDTGRNGYAAWYAVAQRAGLPVRRFERVLGTLDAGIQTLVVSGYENDPAAKPLDANDAKRLAAFVTRGGRLVVLDTEFAGRDDLTPGIGTSVQSARRGALAIARNRFTAGVARVDGAVDAVFPFKERQGVPLLANDSGVAAIAYSYGRGEVVAITAPALLGNANIGAADNAAFGYDVLAGHGPIAFDEYVHGYDENLSFWDALPAPVHVAFFIVLAIVALALVGANVPFVPAVPLDPPDERDSSGYIDAMAALMRHARVPPRKEVYER
jgi:hypothetical protein